MLTDKVINDTHNKQKPRKVSMKTRTSTIFYATLLFTALNVVGCKNAGLNGSATCALNYEEALKQHQERVANGQETEADAPRECQLPTAEPGANLGINIVMTNFNNLQKAKMNDAIEKMKIVLNSIDFKERVIGHTYNGKRTFVDNNGMTNEEIYQAIMEGAETLMPEIDHEMDIDVTMYYKRSSTVGYTYPDTTKTWVNSRFFNGYTIGDVAANSTHEWTHKLGFTHSYYNNAARPYSVPYGIGSIMSELVDSL